MGSFGQGEKQPLPPQKIKIIIKKRKQKTGSSSEIHHFLVDTVTSTCY